IEALHDLIARPRRIEEYDHWNDCGRHYSDFAVGTGRALYRHRVNRALAVARIPLRLAESGEDAGRLVRVEGDARDGLVAAMLADAEGPTGDAVQHAIALFRSRDAG